MSDTLGQYTLSDRVGADAVAEVYRATDTSLGRTVTLKILRPAVADNAAIRDTILAAARELQPLSHPNVVELFDIGEEDGKYFLVFEHVTGDTLRATIAGTPLNLRKAVDLGAQLADALAEAHGRGIVHRCLRPDTILITAKGRPKILDFSLVSAPAAIAAQKGAQDASPDETECQSPEQVLGERGDERTDLFALGCILFEMLTGTSPFTAATGPDTAVAILGRTPPPPSQMNARVPDSLDRLVARCLSKSLDRRAASAAAIASELREIAARMELEDGSPRRPAGVLAPPANKRRSPLWLILLLLIVLLALAATTYVVTR